VIARDKNLVGKLLFAEPVQEIDDLVAITPVANITGMQQHISFRKSQASVPAMRIRNGNKLHVQSIFKRAEKKMSCPLAGQY
jgi:hypothetical protein